MPPRANLKFVFGGEEEAGSPNLDRIILAHRDLLSGTLWLICDGSQYPGNRPLVTFGARGFIGADITVFGARRELHSGNYGNWAPNPALALARLLASMKDDNGRVLIDGFYDSIVPLGPTEQKALRDVPPSERELMADLLLDTTEGSPAILRASGRASLNVRGLVSGHVGAEAACIIPSKATASIDMRIVKGMDYRHTADLLIDHARRQGFIVVESEPAPEVLRTHPRVARTTFGTGANAFRTSTDLPVARAVIRAVEAVHGPVIKLPTMDGSLPVAFIGGTLNTQLINIHMSNPDSNNHSSNENLRLQNLWDGIEQAAGLLLLDLRP